jgi:hypothetical protein
MGRATAARQAARAPLPPIVCSRGDLPPGRRRLGRLLRLLCLLRRRRGSSLLLPRPVGLGCGGRQRFAFGQGCEVAAAGCQGGCPAAAPGCDGGWQLVEPLSEQRGQRVCLQSHKG